MAIIEGAIKAWALNKAQAGPGWNELQLYPADTQEEDVHHVLIVPIRKGAGEELKHYIEKALAAKAEAK